MKRYSTTMPKNRKRANARKGLIDRETANKKG